MAKRAGILRQGETNQAVMAAPKMVQNFQTCTTHHPLQPVSCPWSCTPASFWASFCCIESCCAEYLVHGLWSMVLLYLGHYSTSSLGFGPCLVFLIIPLIFLKISIWIQLHPMYRTESLTSTDATKFFSVQEVLLEKTPSVEGELWESHTGIAECLVPPRKFWNLKGRNFGSVRKKNTSKKS